MWEEKKLPIPSRRLDLVGLAPKTQNLTRFDESLQPPSPSDPASPPARPFYDVYGIRSALSSIINHHRG
jgi:hypothetical protein